MSSVLHYKTVFLIFCLFAYSLPALAQPEARTAEISLSNGYAATDSESFDATQTFEALLRSSPKFMGFRFESGVSYFDKFKRKSSTDSYIDMYGGLLGISRSFQIGKHGRIEAGIHHFFYESNAYSFGRRTGSNSDSTTSVNIRGIYDMDKISLTGGLRWYENVSGVEIRVMTIGMDIKL